MGGFYTFGSKRLVLTSRVSSILPITLKFGMHITHEWESLAKTCVLVNFRGVIGPNRLPISPINSYEQS